MKLLTNKILWIEKQKHREFMKKAGESFDENLKRECKCYYKFNKWRQNLIKKELKEGMNK